MREVRLNSNEIARGLNALDNWTLDAQEASISKEWIFDSFKRSIGFIVSVSEIAERHNHHPEFLSTYPKVRIRLLTHDAHGLTQLDFKLAIAIDQLMKSDL